MERTTAYNSYAPVIKRFEIGEPVDVNYPEADYIISRVDVLDSLQASSLLDKGFRLLDRVLFFEIPTKDYNDEGVFNMLPDVQFICDRSYDEDVYELAYSAYPTDRRFHLDPVFHQERANINIKAYIDNCRSKGYIIYKAKSPQQLLGFTIVNEEADEKGILFENVLGATHPGIKGKMIAAPLYSFMLYGERGSFKKYGGRVSSSNAASINLHTQLGGRVKYIYDEFIYTF